VVEGIHPVSLSAKSASLFKRDVFLFGANLLTGVIIARTLGPSALGLWVILQMILGYAEAFGRLQWDYAAIYLLGQKKYELSDVVFTLNAGAVIMSGLIVGLVLWRFDWLYGVLFAKSESDVRLYMYLILLQVPLQFISLNYSYLHIYREDIRAYNGMVIIKSLFSSAVGITLLIVFKLGVLAVVASSILSVLAGLVYGVVKFGPTGGPRKLFNAGLIRDLFSYGFMIYLTNMVAQLNVYVTRLIVVFYLAPAHVAYLAMAQNQGQLLNRVPDAINTLLYARIAKMPSPDESAILAARAFRIVLLILTVSGVAAFLVITPVVRFLYGRSFLAMIVPFRIILPGLVLSGATTVLNQYFTGIGRADLCAKMALVPLLIQVPAAIVLIPAIGLPGAAIALLLALLSLSLLQLVVFLRISPCTARKDLIVRTGDLREVVAFLRAQLTIVTRSTVRTSES
jgi:O-antigen/teichoic acid export membrane protein